MIVVSKEGLSSKELVSHAKELQYLKSKIISTAMTHTNVRESFDQVLFGKSFENTLTYTL